MMRLQTDAKTSSEVPQKGMGWGLRAMQEVQASSPLNGTMNHCTVEVVDCSSGFPSTVQKVRQMYLRIVFDSTRAVLFFKV